MKMYPVKYGVTPGSYAELSHYRFSCCFVDISQATTHLLCTAHLINWSLICHFIANHRTGEKNCQPGESITKHFLYELVLQRSFPCGQAGRFVFRTESKNEKTTNWKGHKMISIFLPSTQWRTVWTGSLKSVRGTYTVTTFTRKRRKGIRT